MEKVDLMITVYHQIEKACRMMTNGGGTGPDGQIFLSNPHTNNEFSFFLTILILHFDVECHKYTKMRHYHDYMIKQTKKISVFRVTGLKILCIFLINFFSL